MKNTEEMMAKAQKYYDTMLATAWDTYKNTVVLRMLAHITEEKEKENVVAILEQVYKAGYNNGHLASTLSVLSEMSGKPMKTVVTGFMDEFEKVFNDLNKSKHSGNITEAYELNSTNTFKFRN